MELKIPKNMLFKWIGGKKWLSEKLSHTVSTNFNKNTTYIEPFIGGMGAFLSILPTLQKNNIENVILNDINETIITTFKLVKEDPEKVYKNYFVFENKYLKSVPVEVYNYHKTKDKEEVKKLLQNSCSVFNDTKKRFNVLKLLNKRSIIEDFEMVGAFLFLQDHCFNGVYRENSKGEYNTPFNWDNKKYYPENKKQTINDFSKLFNDFNIVFENLDVFKLLNKYKHLKNEAFLYLDPPYLNEDKGENKYNKDHFGYVEQVKLLKSIDEYHNFVFSNHSVKLFKDFFSNKNKSFVEVGRKNIMTSKKEDRGNDIMEILGIKK